MSKEVDRHQVFRTTRVRHTLKDDSCWILKSKQEKAGQDEDRPNHDEENQMSPTRQKSYVLSTAKIFGSVDSSVSPLHKEVTPSEGDSVNHPNGDVIPVEPEVSTVETAADTNVVNKTNEEQSNGGAEVPADVPEAECIQPVASAEENPEAAAPAEPAEPQLVITTIEEIKEDVETTAAGVPAETGAVESNDTAEIHADAAPVAVVQPEECSLIKAEPANVVDVEDAGAEESTLPEGESCEENPSEQATEEIIAAPAEFSVDSSPETVVVTDTASEEQAPLPPSVESVPDIVESVSQSPPQPAVEISAGDEGAVEAATESGEAAAEAVVESTPETPVVTETTQEEEVVPDIAVQSVPDIISEPPAPPADGATAEDVTDNGPAEGSEVNVGAAVEVVVESSTENPVSETTLEEEEAASHNAVQPVPDVVSEPAAPAAAEDSSNQHLAEPVTEEIVIEAAAEVVQESSPETPAVEETTPEEDASASAVQPAPETVSEPSDAPAPETVTTSVECEVQSAAQAEPLLEATTEEVVECEVQPVESNATVEQTVEPTPQPETNRVVELDINDALETTASEAEAVQAEVPDAVVKLSDGTDLATPVSETVHIEPAADPKLDHSEEPEPSPQCEETNTSEEVQKPVEEVNTPYILYTFRDGICSFCSQNIGNVKITLSDPAIQCHPECLKCGICALTLGDLLTPMFLRGQVIQCGGCAASALKT